MPRQKHTIPTTPIGYQYSLLAHHGHGIPCGVSIIGKRCSRCKEIKPIDDFPMDSSRPNRRYVYCRRCTNQQNYDWRERNPEKRKAIIQKHAYGMAHGEYPRMYSEQNGRCFVCQEPHLKLDVDHDHQTKKVRALLCRHCNLAIGHARDNPALCEKLAAYLRKFGR